MPLDTSSYYPELPDDEKEGTSLNKRGIGLFKETSSPDVEIIVEEKPVAPHKKQGNEEEESPEEKIVTLISHFLSWVLVPLLMPVYGLILAFGLSVLDVVQSTMKLRFILIVAGINFVIPVLLVLLMKFLGMIDDVGLNGRKERLIPYLISMLCFGATAWFMADRGAPMWLIMFYAGGAVAAIINLLVNFKWKISAHAAGIAGVVALLIRMERDVAAAPELFVWLLIVVGLAGLMGSARIWLGRHTAWQVLAGYLVGFCSVFFMMYIQ